MRRFAISAALLMGLALPAAAPAQTAPPRLTFGFSGDATTRVVGYGKEATATGVLKDYAGAPIASATLQVSVRQLRDGAVDAPAGNVVTGADGGFQVGIPAGPSRAVTVTYTPAAQAPVTATVNLAVRAGVTLRATPRALRTGQLVRLSGTLRGRPLPSAGKLVDLEVRRGGRWRFFKEVRARPTGSYAFRYRFRKVRTKRTLRFRAVVPTFSGYPYARGVSRSVRVTVRGRGSA